MIVPRPPLSLSKQQQSLSTYRRRYHCDGEDSFADCNYIRRFVAIQIDAANNVRGLPSIQKRGRWASKKSVQRYEKAGRLQDTWRELTARQKDHFKLCAESLRSVMLENRGYPPVMGA